VVGVDEKGEVITLMGGYVYIEGTAMGWYSFLRRGFLLAWKNGWMRW